MKRRTVLLGAGITLSQSLAGCLDDTAADDQRNGDESESTGTTEETEAPEPMNAFTRTVSIATVDSVPEEALIDFEVDMIETQMDERSTAFLEITSTNTGDSIQTTVPYYKGRSADNGDPGILLYALVASDSPTEDHTPECIDDPKPTQESVTFTEEGYAPELQPGESLTEEYIIVDDPSVDGCIPPGEYRFEKKQNLNSEDGDSIEFTWGFTLQVHSEPKEE